MPPRTRGRTATYTGQYKSSNSSSLNTLVKEHLNDYVQDVTGTPFQDHPFTLIKRRTSQPSLDGVRNPLEPTHPSYWKCPLSGWNTIPPPLVYPVSDPESDVARAIATTNPSRPDVLLPAFIAELKDLPDMIKYGAEVGKFLIDAAYRRRRGGPTRVPRQIEPKTLSDMVRPSIGHGFSAAKEVAIANLAIQFGVLPFIGDLQKMFNFTENVEKRRGEMDRLYGGSGLKRRVTLSEASDRQGPTVRAVMTLGRTFNRPVTSLRTMHRWAVVRYKPTNTSPLPPSDAELRRMLLGLNLDSIGSVAWELLPWSWLADYFGNVGHTVKAANNHLNTSYTGTIMTERTTTDSFPGTTFILNGQAGRTSKYTMTSGSRKISMKERYVIGRSLPLPSFGLPILGGRQLSILNSIFATRVLR